MDSLKSRLQSGEVLVGTCVLIPHPMAVEALGTVGFDFLLIEGEHTAVNRADIASLIRAADAVSMPTLVRVPNSDSIWIATALDAGAGGIVVPQVETAEQAQAVVDAARFHPIGKRGVGLSRPAGYGTCLANYLESANDNCLVAIMVETQLGLSNIEAIAAVEGIDVVMVGPGDLAFSLEVFNAKDKSPLLEAIANIRSACTRLGRMTGHFHKTVDALQDAIDDGVQLNLVGCDLAYLIDGAREVARGAGRSVTRDQSDGSNAH